MRKKINAYSCNMQNTCKEDVFGFVLKEERKILLVLVTIGPK